MAEANEVVMECDCCNEEKALTTEVLSHDGEDRGEFSSLPSRAWADGGGQTFPRTALAVVAA